VSFAELLLFSMPQDEKKKRTRIAKYLIMTKEKNGSYHRANP